MNRNLLGIAIASVALLLASRAPAGPGLAGGRRVQVEGYIGDFMCGLRHGHSKKTTEAEDRDCTIQCVHEGSRYVLADRSARKVYDLEDQAAPRRFAGQKVRVTGELEDDGLRIETIEPAK